MSKALVWIRKSEGAEDDIGLEIQRKQLPTLVDVDTIETIDLGVHTGFSRVVKPFLPEKEEYIDENEEVQRRLEQLRNGEFDYLVAWDPSRLSRDGFLRVVELAAAVGDAEIIWGANDVPEDRMVRDIMHVVEMWIKLREIRKSMEAKQKRRENGNPDGRPPFGFKYNSDSTGFEIDPEEFDVALDILEMDADGASQREIARNVEPSRYTVRKVLDNRDMILNHAPD